MSRPHVRHLRQGVVGEVESGLPQGFFHLQIARKAPLGHIVCPSPPVFKPAGIIIEHLEPGIAAVHFHIGQGHFNSTFALAGLAEQTVIYIGILSRVDQPADGDGESRVVGEAGFPGILGFEGK